MDKEDVKQYTVSEILETALRREKASYKFYDSILKKTNLEVLRDVLEELRGEEYKHIRIIEQQMVKLDLS